MKAYRTSLALIVLLSLAGCSALDVDEDSQQFADTQATDCVGDLDFAAAFLLDNDAGIQGAGWKTYPSKVKEVLKSTRIAAFDMRSPEACAELLNQFMESIRRGHLAAAPIATNATVSTMHHEQPRVTSRRLSARTSYLEVPSFGGDIRQQLVDLIETNQSAIQDVPNLVIDLRQNGGGNDSSFQPLLSLLGPATYSAQYPDVFVTNANIAAWEAIIPYMSRPADLEWLNQLIDRMKTVGRGWVAMSDEQMLESHYDSDQVKASPERVVLLIGQGCGSSCEQFVITAHQNSRVTLMGRRTFGALDASNVREIKTPSGKIVIYYATTFVRRPAGQQIDQMGIIPDVELPLPTDDSAYNAEIDLAQRAVEL